MAWAFERASKVYGDGHVHTEDDEDDIDEDILRMDPIQEAKCKQLHNA